MLSQRARADLTAGRYGRSGTPRGHGVLAAPRRRARSAAGIRPPDAGRIPAPRPCAGDRDPLWERRGTRRGRDGRHGGQRRDAGRRRCRRDASDVQVAMRCGVMRFDPPGRHGADAAAPTRRTAPTPRTHGEPRSAAAPTTPRSRPAPGAARHNVGRAGHSGGPPAVAGCRPGWPGRLNRSAVVSTTRTPSSGIARGRCPQSDQ